MEEELDKDAVLSPILFNLYSEYHITETLEGFGDFKIKGKAICTCNKYMTLCYWIRKKRCCRE
jgi:hypothetical protein